MTNKPQQNIFITFVLTSCAHNHFKVAPVKHGLNAIVRTMSQIVNRFKMIFVIFFMGTCGLFKFSKKFLK